MLSKFQIAIFFIIIFSVSASLQSKLKFYQYCIYHGYPVQQHIIRTDDGYNLKFFRIQKKNTTFVEGLKVVYLQHGLTDSSDTWIVNDEHLAPGFYFANKGYDVWFGNVRGNKYSNPTLSPTKREFWDFTFDQMAQFDLPAAFKYISNKTNSKINYVGHSQGTMIMFAALASKYQHVQSNLQSYSALGPVAYLTNMKSIILKQVAKTTLPSLLQKSNVNQCLMPTNSQYQIQSKFCTFDLPACKLVLTQISQMNNTVNNVKRLPVIMAHFPAGTSTKNVQHFQQFANKAQFKKFDYGQKTNIKKYGTATPPFYDFKKISFPVHMFVGKYDKLANLQDAKKAYNQMINSPGKTFRELNFGHATFIWGKDNSFLDEIVKIIENSSENNKLISNQ